MVRPSGLSKLRTTVTYHDNISRLSETVHTSMLTYAMYFYTVLNHANPSILTTPIW